MRPGIPGEPIVEHVKNAPSPMMGIGFITILVGFVLMMFGSLGENLKTPILTYIGILGILMMFLGLALIGIGYAILDRRWKKEGDL